MDGQRALMARFSSANGMKKTHQANNEGKGVDAKSWSFLRNGGPIVEPWVQRRRHYG